MGTVSKSFFYPVEPRQVHAIHDDPCLWHTWLDGAQGPGEVTGDGSAGTTCVLRLKAGGVTQAFRIEVEESTIDDSGGRWVGAVSSPNLRIRETRTYRAEGTGTREIWDFHYEPVGFSGLLLRPFLGRIVARSMDRTGHNLQALCLLPGTFGQ